jgi:hypothetical protein
VAEDAALICVERAADWSDAGGPTAAGLLFPSEMKGRLLWLPSTS